MMNKESCETSIDNFNELYLMNSDDPNYDIRKEYCAFSVFIQSLFISKNAYVINTGNFQTVNYHIMDIIKEKVEKHPLLWKIFFMIV